MSDRETPARRAGKPSGNPLDPYKQALRPHFPGKDALLQEARAYGRRGRRRMTRSLGALAVAVAALWLADPAVESVRLATDVGQRQQWSLADGTRIQLNTDSIAVLESHLHSRRLRLERGETQVVVAHGWRGFTVQAGGTKVIDIGTAFNVRRDSSGGDGGGNVEVAVIDGAVEVKPSAPGDAIHLSSGQLLSIHDGRPGRPVALPAAMVAWADGRLVFDGTPLRDVLAEIQRYRRAPIRLADARAGTLRLSGEYKLAELESLLDALPDLLPLRVSRHADGSLDIASRQKNL